jgi:hypothetical protein
MVGAMAAMFAISAILSGGAVGGPTRLMHSACCQHPHVRGRRDPHTPCTRPWCSTLTVALYTADLTSTVLQESLIGNNVKKVSWGADPSVVEGAGQMGHEFPRPRTAIVPVDRSVASSLMP